MQMVSSSTRMEKSSSNLVGGTGMCVVRTTVETEKVLSENSRDLS